MNRSSIWLLLLLLIGTILASVRAEARPSYAARTGRTCAKCHIDPAGGGIRSGTGFRYAWNLHTFTPDDDREPSLDPWISEGHRLGADLRAQYTQEVSDGGRERSTFLLMQKSLHLMAEINHVVSLVFTNDGANTLEGFALFSGLPLGTALKVGKFRPAFGLDQEDHTTFTRDALGFGLGSEDTGVELLILGRSHQTTIAVTNGAPGSIIDNNEQKAALVRTLYQLERGGVGLSGAVNSPGLATRDVKRRYRYGCFGFFHHDPLTLLFEYDRGYDCLDGRSNEEMEAAFWEVSYLFRRRFTGKVRFDRLDPNLDHAETARDRVALGIESDLLSLTRLLVFVRGLREYGTNESGIREIGKTRDSLEILAQLHVSF